MLCYVYFATLFFKKSQIEPCYVHEVQVLLPGTLRGKWVLVMEDASTCV